MKLKWLFGAGLLGIVVFFSAIYLGMKYNWVSSSKPNAEESEVIQQTLNPKPEVNSPPVNTLEKNGNGVSPELIGEIDIEDKGKVLGELNLSIEEVVSLCQNLSQSIGVPEEKLEQSINECVDRNSLHLRKEGPIVDNERELLLREQCDIAITQKEFLSDEEITMLIDECVASMR